jgi:H+/Cl- antiporter ClcA
VLAPIGGAFGALVTPPLPHVAAGFWPLICLAGVIGAAMRAPFNAVVFSAELTGRWSAVLPLLIGATGAYLFTALTLKRSVLTGPARASAEVVHGAAITPHVLVRGRTPRGPR